MHIINDFQYVHFQPILINSTTDYMYEKRDSNCWFIGITLFVTICASLRQLLPVCDSRRVINCLWLSHCLYPSHRVDRQSALDIFVSGGGGGKEKEKGGNKWGGKEVGNIPLGKIMKIKCNWFILLISRKKKKKGGREKGRTGGGGRKRGNLMISGWAAGGGGWFEFSDELRKFWGMFEVYWSTCSRSCL